jgi:hypothetical protein
MMNPIWRQMKKCTPIGALVATNSLCPQPSSQGRGLVPMPCPSSHSSYGGLRSQSVDQNEPAATNAPIGRS